MPETIRQSNFPPAPAALWQYLRANRRGAAGRQASSDGPDSLRRCGRATGLHFLNDDARSLAYIELICIM